MTSLAHDPKGVTGFRLDQLAAAFDRVRDDRDRQRAVHAAIPAEDRLLVEQAVPWFRSTKPVFEDVPGVPDRLVVTSEGHRS